MRKIIYAYNGDSESNGLYDETGKLITGWQDGDDITFQFRRLFKHLGIDFATTKMPEPDGSYPEWLDLYS